MIINSAGQQRFFSNTDKIGGHSVTEIKNAHNVLAKFTSKVATQIVIENRKLFKTQESDLSEIWKCNVKPFFTG